MTGEATAPPGAGSADHVRLRYGRIVAFGLSVLVTATAVLGGLGVLPSGDEPAYAVAPQSGADHSEGAASLAAAAVDTPRPEEAPGTTPRPDDTEDREPPVPADSGDGRRVVFDEGTQRVWLVKADGSVQRTYPVSGSIYDNLDPGTYSVFSRDKEAWGIDGSELRYMVRFTTGSEAAIGFHNIPVLEGEKVQTPDELGTPLSHGCVRQQARDAKALWEFAPLGTTVVVVDTTTTATGQSEVG